LLLLASIVLSGLLDGKASLGASGVEVAVVVHGLLKGVVFPAEDIVTVCSRTTRSLSVSCAHSIVILFKQASGEPEAVKELERRTRYSWNKRRDPSRRLATGSYRQIC
jgi:hypothetical protein